jgi:hypothetical protein
MFFNRRKHEREVVKDCEVDFMTNRWNCRGQVLDISDGGMRVDIDMVPEMHEEVQVSATLQGGRKLNKRAVVVWFLKKIPPETGAMVGLKYF